MVDKSPGQWRVGTKSPETRRNLWYSPDGNPANDEYRGVIFDPDEGPRIADALNGGVTSEFAYALKLVESLTDREPCQWDHNHSCQSHLYFYLDPAEQCPMQLAKDLVKKHGFGETE
jgi:hypothetical protein